MPVENAFKLMNSADFAYLTTPEAQDFIAQNLYQDPSLLALSNQNRSIPLALLVSQIKYLQRCKYKLPAYFKNRCLIPALAYQQASSQLAASVKVYSGKNCLDLTCGLGVDSVHFAEHFDQVIALEPNALLAAITRYNFTLLGIQNISLIQSTAEAFLAQYKGAVFDLIYIDPSRERAGERVFLPEDCSPNVFDLWPKLASLGKKILIKLSPLFDVAAALHRFSYVTKLSVLSINRECKELLLEMDALQNNSSQPSLPNTIFEAIICRQNTVKRYVLPASKPMAIVSMDSIRAGSYVYQPDVSFYKMRAIAGLFQAYFPTASMTCSGADGYVFGTSLLASFPGSVFQVKTAFRYQPKKMKQVIKALGISRAHVSKRNFPLSTKDLRKQVDLKEGGNQYLLFTLIAGKRMVMIAELIE